MKPFVALAGLAALLALGGCAGERAAPSAAACAEPAAYGPAGAYNAAAERNLAFAPFGRAEQGWAAYAPAIGRAVRSACPPASPAFARAVARWQARAGLIPHGGVDPATFAAIKQGWEQRRPFVRLRAAGICPNPPDEAGLAAVPAADAWRGAEARLRPGALRAYERMVAAARREDPRIAADPEALAVFSAYRSPAYDAGRCALQHNCDGVVRAACSSHRTGLAVDLALGAAPGFAVDSSADPNRLHQTTTPAYRWLVANAGRFGFVNYVFEPWHWEWTGEAP
jgi:hypothetical protein